MLSYGPLYPAIPLIRHHHYFVSITSVLVFLPRCTSVCETDPILRMLRGDIPQSLGGVAELVRLEHEVDIDPMMRLLPEGTNRKGVTDVENVTVNFLGRMLGQILC